MSNRTVDISLLGRTYSIACPEGQEDALLIVAKKLEAQLDKMKKRNVSREEMFVMAGLNIGYELYKEQNKNQEYMQKMDEKIRLLQSTLEQALVDRTVID